MQFTRRNLLLGTAAGGGLIALYGCWPHQSAAPLPAGKGENAFNGWIKIANDGMVSIAVPQLEMGQGITTILPQIAATEMGADWRQVAVEPAPISANYLNLPLAADWAQLWQPFWDWGTPTAQDSSTLSYARRHLFMDTAGDTSIAAYETPLREAAASVRAVLAMAAAEKWNVDWQSCEAKNGFITHGTQRLSFGSLAQAAAELSPPSTPPLEVQAAAEMPADFPAGMNSSYSRLDAPSKVDGTYNFAGDIRLPGLLYASAAHGPIAPALLKSYDRAAGLAVPGVTHIVKAPQWIAAVGTGWWAADKAIHAMKPRFDVEGAAADSDAVEAAINAALSGGEGKSVFEAGEGSALQGTKASLTARYDFAPMLAAPVETASATARWQDGKLELWTAAQSPQSAREAAAEALGISSEDVVLYPMGAGGSFDARLETEVAPQAALIAREVGAPVQLIWSRHQETMRARPRPPASVRMSGWLGPNGTLTGLWARYAMPASAYEFGRRVLDGKSAMQALPAQAKGGDRMALEGAQTPYQIPNLAVDHYPAQTGLPTGRVRGNSHSITAFANECFIDELALKAGSEPLSFRMAMLGGDPRLAQCLSGAATMADWDGGAPSSGQGLACHRIGEGAIAVIASAGGGESGVRVTELAAMVDIGRIINIDIARQQIEGGLIFGLAMAMGASVQYAKGMPVSSRYANLQLPKLSDCPKITIDFINSTADPVEPGEIGAVAVAPAIANALRSATGMRFRRLPLYSDGI